MADPERQPLIRSTPNTPLTPLLPSDRRFITALQRSEDFIACHVQKIHGADSWVWGLRHNLQRFLSSKWGHYFVIVLVTADISCIFADFLVSLHMCEHGGDTGFDLYAWRQVNEVLGYMSLVFSCLFVSFPWCSVELVGVYSAWCGLANLPPLPAESVDGARGWRYSRDLRDLSKN
ncbi:hypothetical protein CLCR_09193 [Cladophialophora carrionii]|uniref:Uncharacterized protein n=1 Tax=Cladophialophora carrionii TaxID=86049 RepID=A0A1C1CUX6_9EURO|nr:hypothetical protein CLCR_09193 [Cladophialophora carrionii]